MDLEKLIKEASDTVETYRELMPEQMSGFDDLMETVGRKGALSAKHKQEIMVAVAIASQCKWCITYHTKKALEMGASKEELLEAAWIAILMGGGPALMHSRIMLEAIQEFGK